MNRDVFEGKWKQIRGQSRVWWGKLTDADVNRVDGRLDVLAGMLQQNYGCTRDAAASEIDRRLSEHEASMTRVTEPTRVS